MGAHLAKGCFLLRGGTAQVAASAKERAEQRASTEERCWLEAPFTLHPSFQDGLVMAEEAVAPF